jgi:hypothetical protein
VALENATPLLLIVFGFGYAVYAFYKHITGRSGHSHGIPIVKLIRLDFFEKYGDIIAGLIIGLIGILTKVFEL